PEPPGTRMHEAKTGAWIAAFALAALGAAPLAAQDDVARQVTTILRDADAGSVDGAWLAGRRLADLPGQTDAIARAVIAAAEGAGSKARLAAAAGLRELADGEMFGKEILAL